VILRFVDLRRSRILLNKILVLVSTLLCGGIEPEISSRNWLRRNLSLSLYSCMACRGSGVRVSLAPFFKTLPPQGISGSRKAPFLCSETGLEQKLEQNPGPDRCLFYRRQAPPAFSPLSPVFCGVSPISIEATGQRSQPAVLF